MVSIKTINKTCESHPAQWEGTLTNGKMFHIRYRWGILVIRVSQDATNDIDDALNDDSFCILSECIGDWFDGEMSDIKMLGYLNKALKRLEINND